jgi:hypothetical protein
LVDGDGVGKGFSVSGGYCGSIGARKLPNISRPLLGTSPNVRNMSRSIGSSSKLEMNDKGVSAMRASSEPGEASDFMKVEMGVGLSKGLT